jgi:transposase
MANQQRRRYTKEFKEQAVELTYSRGKQLREVEEDLGINASMLGRWRREMKENPYACFSGAGNVQHASSEAAEIARLKKEVGVR